MAECSSYSRRGGLWGDTVTLLMPHHASSYGVLTSSGPGTAAVGESGRPRERAGSDDELPELTEEAVQAMIDSGRFAVREVKVGTETWREVIDRGRAV